MYGYNVPSLERLIEQFERLPGIGHKSAERLAYYMLSLPVSEAEKFANTVVDARKKIHFCKVCCNFTDKDICPVCSDENRDRSIIIVVKEPKDVVAIERTREFHVTYHVLHGLSILVIVGPEPIGQGHAFLGEREGKHGQAQRDRDGHSKEFLHNIYLFLY